MAALKSEAVAAMETAIGRPITYSSISPSFLQYLEVRDLAIHDRADPSRILLTIKKVRVYYGLARLLMGGEAAGSVREIRILNTHLALDTERDRDVIDLIRQLTGSTGGGSAGTGLRARISGSDVSLDLTTPQGSFSFSNVFFQLGTLDPSIRVNLRGSWAGRLASGFSFASSLRLEGSVERNLNAVDVTVRFASFDSSLFSARKQTLQLVWKGPHVEVRKIQDRQPVDLDVTADLDTQMLSVNFQIDQLRPDQLVTLAGGLARYRSWMTAPITASGEVTVGLSDGSLSYQVSLATVLEDQLPVHGVDVLSSLHGDARQIYFDPLRLSTPMGTLEFSGDVRLSDLYPEGSLVLADVGASSTERVSAQLALERTDGRLEAKSARMAFGQLSFDGFDLVMTPIEGGAHFSVQTSFSGSGPAAQVQAAGELRLGQMLRAAMSETTEPAESPLLSLTASLRRIQPEKLYHLLLGAGELTQEDREIYRVLSRFTISTDLALSTDFSSFTLSSQKVTVTQGDDPGTVLRFALAADTSHVVLSGFSGTWRGLTVEGGIEGSFPSHDQIEFASDLRFRGLPYSLSGTYSPHQGLRASGSYNMALSAVTLRDGTVSVSLSAERFPLPLAARPQIVSFDLQGNFSPSGAWVVSAPSLTVYDLPFLQSQKNTVELAGRMTVNKLELTRLRFSDAFSTVEGTATADLTLPSDLFASQFLRSISAVVNASLQSSRGGERYAVAGAVNGDQLTASVQFAGSPLARLASFTVRGSLTGAATVSGTFEQPRLEANVRLTDGKLGTDPLAVSTRLTLARQVVTVSDLSVGYLSHRLATGSGSLDLANGALTLSARYQGEYFADPVQLAVDLNASFQPSDGGAALTGLLDHALKGSITLSNISVAGAPYASWGVAFRTTGGRLTFDGGPGGSIRGSLDSSNAFSLTLAQPLPLIGQVNGKFVGDQVSATLSVDTIDLLLLNPVLKVASISTTAGSLPIFKVTSGVASGQLSIEGPINDPDYTGELDVVGGGLQSAYSPDEAGPVAAQLVFDGKGFHTGPITTAVGNAQLSAQATFTLDHWVPRTYDVTLSTVGTNPVHVRAKFGRFNAEGYTAGQVEISGDDTRTNVTGSLTGSDCTIALGEAPVGKFVPEDPPTFVSITAETGRRVEFNWPSVAFPVLRSTAVPGGKIAVTYRGDTGAYTVKGVTGVQGGEIYYFDQSFILTKGSITFDEDEANFDPRITAHAEVREWDPDTAEEVKIYLDADSTLSTFSPRFSSDPARTDTAILAMLGAPLLTKAESQGLGLSAALISSDILSQSWILRPFEQRVRTLLNLDMFSIRTELIQNLVAQKLLGSTVNPLDNTSVSLGKYIGNDLFLEAMVQLQSQQLPVGTVLPTGTLPVGGVGLSPDVELSIEWATPFFLLNWSFQPKHPEDLFLSDNSLSLSWKLSY